MEKTATAPRFGGRHFDNIKEGMPQMEWIGGPERLQAVQKSMEIFFSKVAVFSILQLSFPLYCNAKVVTI